MFAKSKHTQITQATDSHYTATSPPAHLSPPQFNMAILQFTTADYMGNGKRKHLLFDYSQKCTLGVGDCTPSLQPKMKS